MSDFDVVRPLRRVASLRPLPVGTVTFLLADIEGSVRLWEADEAAMTRALPRLDALVEQLAAAHEGARPVEQGEGDSFVVAFAEAEDAVAFALELQLAIAAEPWPGEIRLRARMAMHTGNAQLRDEGNYIGTTISRGGRLRSLAHGGQTLLSATTYELVADSLPERTTVRDLGLQQMRDVARPLRVYQLVHPDLEDTFPPLRSLEVLTRNLPAPLSSFIGREAELADLEPLLAEVKLLTLTGAGGCGKTRLALRLAELTAEHYPDGIWFVDLSSVRDESEVERQVAVAVHRNEEGHRPVIETIVAQLRPRRALLVLDNCEHVVAACASLVDALLRECTALTILATSREPLRVEGEAVWRVPSLATPDTGEGVALTTYDAVRLFIDRAVRARPNFSVTNDNAAAVAAICQQLDGLPLGIELAAARVRLLTPDEIVAGLSDQLHLLRGGNRGALERQQTLLASVEWSHDLLTEPERVLLRRLSVFVGGFTLDAAEQLVPLDDLDPLDVLDLLSSLVDKSLVVTGAKGPDGRYRLLETLRQYAAERARDAGETDRLRARHADVFAAFAAEISPQLTGAEQQRGLARLSADHDNLRAALEWASTHDPALGCRIVIAVWMFWNVRGHWHEALRIVDKLLAAGEDVPPAPRNVVVAVRAGMAAMVGRVDEALPVLEELAESSRDGHPLFRAWVLNQLGKFVSIQDAPRGRAYLVESEAAAREAADTSVLCDSLAYAANLELAMGHTTEALALIETGRRAASAEGDLRALALTDGARGAAAIRMADLALAETVAEEALATAQEIGDPFSVAQALLQQGEVALLRGSYGIARQKISEAVDVGRETGSPMAAVFEASLARLAWFEGDPVQACALYETGIRGRERAVSWLFVLTRGSGGLPDWLLALGRLDEARQQIEAALSFSEPAGHVIATAHALLHRARLNQSMGERGQAETDCHRALAVFADAHAAWDVTAALELLAVLAADSQSWAESARLLGACNAAREAGGWLPPVYEREALAALADRLDRELGGAEMAAARADGQAMSLAEAVAYAARGRGERGRPSTGWDSLTPTEREVVGLVARGSSNREIGVRLFISPNTVKTHLSHVFAKLGISTRAELAALATRREPG